MVSTHLVNSYCVRLETHSHPVSAGLLNLWGREATRRPTQAGTLPQGPGLARFFSQLCADQACTTPAKESPHLAFCLCLFFSLDENIVMFHML